MAETAWRVNLGTLVAMLGLLIGGALWAGAQTSEVKALRNGYDTILLEVREIRSLLIKVESEHAILHERVDRDGSRRSR